MEYIKSLNLYVDWEKGKIYRKKEKSFLDNLLGIFGKSEGGEEYEEVNSKDAELKVKKYKLLELYAIAKKLGKTELKETINGQEVAVRIEPSKVTVETPDLVMEYTAEKFILRNKKTGEVQEKEPTLQEFHQMYKEIRKLLGAGSVENYLHLKAREPEFKQQFAQMQNQGMTPFAQPMGQGGGFSWGSALLGLGGGMLLGYLLGSMMGETFAHEVQHAPELSPEEQQQVEQMTEAPAEEVIGSPVEEVIEDVTVEEIPEPTLEDVEADLNELDENSFADEIVEDNGISPSDIASDDFASFDDFGDEDVDSFDDFDGDDFSV